MTTPLESKPQVKYNLAQFIIQVEAFNANIDVALLRRAYEFSDKAHAGQRRSSGEPFIEHCHEVALFLAELHMDSTTLASGLLHDVVEDTKYTLENIRDEFGDEVADLVDGVSKIGAVEFNSLEEQQAEYFRKMLLSMAKDIRVIIIKLADRMHNMRTLEALPPAKRKRIAQETRDVYAPLAHRLGIYKAKTELEDLALKHLQPDVYADLAKAVKEKEEREAYIEEITKPIKEALLKDGIKADVYGRAKHLDSIQHKIVKRGVPFDQIYDLIAIRVIVQNERECYHTMGILHAMWKPVTGRFHDYIANPKPNGYRSLHTTVFGPRNKTIEIQIRTRKMHEFAENGIAAHWLYKEGRQYLSKDDKQMIWLRGVLEWQKDDLLNPTEFMEYLKMDLYAEDIFVYTPKGRLVHLPRGATPLDFAFQIHTQVGLHCAGAKINGRLQPLSTTLRSGDQVDIITNPSHTPTHDWLKLVRTSSARQRIRRWLNQAGFEQSVALGKEILERRLKEMRLDMPNDAQLQEYAEHLDQKSVEAMFAALGSGALAARNVINLYHPEEIPEAVPGIVGRIVDKMRGSKGVRVQGMTNMMFRFAGCCQPVPGEDIVGFITRGRGVTVHHASCKLAIDLANQSPERKIAVSWDAGRDQSFVVQIDVVVEDRKGMLHDITEAIADSNTNVRGAEIYSLDTTAQGKFLIEVSSLSHLNRIIDKMKKVKGVIQVQRSRRYDPGE